MPIWSFFFVNTASLLERLVIMKLIPLVLVLFCGCSSMYFNALERIGIPKRELLVTRVEAAQETQVEAKEQFSSALQRYRSVVAFDGGSLEDRYNELDAEYTRSSAKAEELANRIKDIESVAEALFEEWEEELEEFSSSSLRGSSEARLKETKKRYAPMVEAMHRAHGSTVPVLRVLHDQVLFLKHNLNARAVGALKGELSSIESDIEILIRRMEVSMSETESFISEIESQG
jgi:ElaB/YqjD/DUF883 family membrane-anchored ribosome-binding protein